ncbi:MFS transporter [Cellulomonas fimi]|uniref:Major facilitator superfamily MFS_1 n=1 Tax=Cellulomonas fimi (strain ATCC 484 / DSM 20113 / JCM 1341 / CCUG 24087 / LMG 16345 / NBRC 15513 / NCIMB 8980 / NCTC 7547 / NRS-133) TaxID=590998 RepID=F4H1E2_CELFA|nr:MFS transporter [Cellulomonas fimi]AEE45113.1 major facilitator superfamily MFS_1 [Cellulomonas fimi ATCC 484]NNH06324.1 MFS transporter [Cellulomonas fimi]VEH28278.1 Inner membrane protein ybjJ [Cellulomonas fimi]
MPAPDPTTADAAAPIRHASLAVLVVFVLNGFNFATWASRLPAIRDGLDFTPEKMGLMLLVGAVGSLVALPLSGMVVERLGARRTVLGFAVLNAFGLSLAAVGVAVGQVLVVGVGMVLYGIGTGVWDAAMNLEGAAVEQRLGRTVMPRYHAGFSFGTVGAAGLSAAMAALHVPVVVHVPVAVTASVVVVAFAVRRFLPEGPHHPHSAGESHAPRGARGALAAWLEPRTLLIGLVVLAAALTEGSANDWVSLAVVDGFETGHAVGALAFGVFVAAMTAMRWFGTALLDRYGRVAVLRLCAVLAIVGLLAFGLAPTLWLALLGVVAWGAGAALGFPVGMSAASDDPLRAAQRVSVVSTIGYSAFLAGPPLLGLLAQHVGYRNALLVILVPVVLGLLVVNAAAPLPAPGAAADEPAPAGRPDAAV